jgi:hypothetical protein
MNSNYSLKNIDDETIVARLKTIIEKNNHLTAVLLAHVAEVDARRLFLRCCVFFDAYILRRSPELLRERRIQTHPCCSRGALSSLDLRPHRRRLDPSHRRHAARAASHDRRPSRAARECEAKIEARDRGDGLRCTFVDRTGRRCSARAFLEIDHRTLFANGGDHSTANVRLMCSAHNAYLALGVAFMENRKKRPAQTSLPRRPLPQGLAKPGLAE